MKKTRIPRKWLLLLILFLFCTAGSTVHTVSVQAAAYVRQEATSVSITSKKTGWRKIHGAYYFYNSKGRMICGSFKYKGHYYYCTANGKRFTGWLKRSGKNTTTAVKTEPCTGTAGL